MIELFIVGLGGVIIGLLAGTLIVQQHTYDDGYSAGYLDGTRDGRA